MKTKTKYQMVRKLAKKAQKVKNQILGEISKCYETDVTSKKINCILSVCSRVSRNF